MSNKITMQNTPVDEFKKIVNILNSGLAPSAVMHFLKSAVSVYKGSDIVPFKDAVYTYLNTKSSINFKDMLDDVCKAWIASATNPRRDVNNVTHAHWIYKYSNQTYAEPFVVLDTSRGEFMVGELVNKRGHTFVKLATEGVRKIDPRHAIASRSQMTLSLALEAIDTMKNLEKTAEELEDVTEYVAPAMQTGKPAWDDIKTEHKPTPNQYPKIIFNDKDFETKTQPPKENEMPLAEDRKTSPRRRVVNVRLLDNDRGLDVSHALVFEKKGVVTEDDNQSTIREVIMNCDLKESLAKHNKTRGEQVDLDVLNRTGNEVKLQPVKLKDLDWEVTEA